MDLACHRNVKFMKVFSRKINLLFTITSTYESVNDILLIERCYSVPRQTPCCNNIEDCSPQNGSLTLVLEVSYPVAYVGVITILSGQATCEA